MGRGPEPRGMRKCGIVYIGRKLGVQLTAVELVLVLYSCQIVRSVGTKNNLARQDAGSARPDFGVKRKGEK